MNDRLLTILIIIVVATVVGSLAYRNYFMNGEAEPEVLMGGDWEPIEEERVTAAWAKLTECTQKGSKIEALGYVENTGNVDLTYVTVKVIWSNRHGLIVEENEKYALNNETLAPGETKKFADTTNSLTATQCNVEPVDWW
ncbi:MAG: hypothetical protein JJ934_00215 [Pseudomonadales bacterium]|nr:hypothetical protein [Pseudomonadales bacterium]